MNTTLRYIGRTFESKDGTPNLVKYSLLAVIITACYISIKVTTTICNTIDKLSLSNQDVSKVSVIISSLAPLLGQLALLVTALVGVVSLLHYGNNIQTHQNPYIPQQPSPDIRLDSPDIKK